MINFVSESSGIRVNKDLRLFFCGEKIRSFKQCNKNLPFVVLGWGKKPSTKLSVNESKIKGYQFFLLEDGFLSYLDHPSIDKKRLSLIIDKKNIYYDFSCESDFESFLIGSIDLSHLYRVFRIDELIKKICNHGISKFNQLPDKFPLWVQEEKSWILLIDQTFGDLSVEYGKGNEESFKQMLKDALSNHPNNPIIIKTHPDVLMGKKKGYFSKDQIQSDRVHFLTDNVNLRDLMAHVEAVYTVTSQLGFEALLYGKKVYCYGMPFYAGWGLTEDVIKLPRRNNQKVTLEQLVAAALIKYPRYLNPDTKQLCEVEEVVDWLILQRKDEKDQVDICFVLGFSFWKRSFVSSFIGRKARKIIFVSNTQSLHRYISKKVSNDQENLNLSVLVWGNKYKDLPGTLSKKHQISVWRMEDGFIRSVGLGAELRRPSSLVIDHKGIYYNPQGHSDIVDQLNSVCLSENQKKRGLNLIQQLNDLALTKYNVGIDSPNTLRALKQLAANKEIILVPGQFEQDQSVICSLGQIKTNYDLLKKVRNEFKDAFIIFKEHPDLYSKTRPGALGSEKALETADYYVTDINIHELILLCDRVCTITSLSGFEALIRRKKVSVYGSPFYAGWGLTNDEVAFPERKNTLSLEDLVYVCLVDYCRCVNWETRRLTSPEFLIDQLSKERHTINKTSNSFLRSLWFSRQWRKLKYFYDSYRY